MKGERTWLKESVPGAEVITWERGLAESAIVATHMAYLPEQ